MPLSRTSVAERGSLSPDGHACLDAPALLQPLGNQPAGGGPPGQHVAWPANPQVNAAHPDQQGGQDRTADKLHPHPARAVHHRDKSGSERNQRQYENELLSDPNGAYSTMI